MKKKKRASKKNPTKSYLTNKLDEACSLIVRSKGFCVRCGNSQYEQLQCCHIFSRTYKSTRWLFDNLLCMCAKCHAWGHSCPVLFTEFVKEYYGDKKYQELKETHNYISKWKLSEMVELLDKLEQTMKEMGVWYGK